MKPITAYYAHKFNPLYHVVHATSYSGCRILFFGLVARSVLYYTAIR